MASPMLLFPLERCRYYNIRTGPFMMLERPRSVSWWFWWFWCFRDVEVGVVVVAVVVMVALVALVALVVVAAVSPLVLHSELRAWR